MKVYSFMKRCFLIIFSFLALNLCVSCELDNYQGPTAGIYGKILDAETGELVPLPVPCGSGVYLELIQDGWPYAYYVNCKADGTFCDFGVFNGDYRVQVRNGAPFIKSDTTEITLHDNQKELIINALPYARIKITDYRFDNTVIWATYEAESVDTTLPLTQIQMLWDYRQPLDDWGHWSGMASSGGNTKGEMGFNLVGEQNFIKNKEKIRANGGKIYLRAAARVNGQNFMNYSEPVEVRLDPEIFFPDPQELDKQN